MHKKINAYEFLQVHLELIKGNSTNSLHSIEDHDINAKILFYHNPNENLYDWLVYL